jgi:hypothetical protein
MAEIVNLRRARKQRERAAKEKDADANRAKHGTPKEERDAEAARKDARDRLLDSHKLDDSQ